MEEGNLGCASILLEAYGRWDRALDLRLTELGHMAGKTKGESQEDEETRGEEEEEVETRGLLLDTLVTLIRDHVLRGPASLLGMPQRLHMLSRVLRVWATHQLPVDRLEALVNQEVGLKELGHVWAVHMLLALLLELLVLRARKSHMHHSRQAPVSTVASPRCPGSGPYNCQ
jgi:hypothetical protein